ncbi:MAG: helix-turn-helix domain-containing protein [Solibacillus sp.]|uniref:PucR family transcriptional regulator n=1 Tax=Solibacillus sp. TaxID=1909654 RepID=UPI0033150B01
MQLAQLFPSLKQHNTYPTAHNSATMIFYDSPNACWYEIAKNEITERDALLLKHFYHECSEQTDPWLLLLTQGVVPKLATYSSIRILQYHINNDSEQLKYAIELFFMHDAYLLEISPTTFWIILFKNYSREELEGFIAILENDFYLHGQLFIGQILPVSEMLHQSFSSEQKMFQAILERQHQTIYTFSECFLTLLPLYLSLPLQQYLQHTLFYNLNDEMITTITTLFSHNGNMSSAAKELHIHRNTLLYRTQRYFEETSLDLKRSDNLLLAYLAAQMKKLTKYP